MGGRGPWGGFFLLPPLPPLLPLARCCCCPLALLLLLPQGRPSTHACPACCAAEFGKTPDNIRCTHWIGDNRLLLVSYLDKPNVE